MSTQTAPPPVPASSAELAAVLGVSARAAADACAAGRIPGAIRLGRAWRIPRRVLAAIAEGRPLAPPQEAAP